MVFVSKPYDIPGARSGHSIFFQMSGESLNVPKCCLDRHANLGSRYQIAFIVWCPNVRTHYKKERENCLIILSFK